MSSTYVGGIHEETNIRITDLLSEELGLNCRPNPSGSDIHCYYRGFNIVIESSHDRGDAEENARKRIEGGEGFDIAIALWLKEGDRYRADLSVSELRELIRGSRFDAALFTSSPQPGLVKFISEGNARLSAGWFIDVDLGFIRDLISDSIEYLIREGEFQAVLSKVINGVNNFIQVMSNAQRVWQDIYNILYRLYGLSLTEARDIEVVFGQAGLSILLSTVLYEHVRSVHNLGSIQSYVENHGSIKGLRMALEELLKYDYRTIVEITIEILGTLPPVASGAVRQLIELGAKIAQERYLLRRDFAGRVYHRIVGDIAHRKGFATFYTEVPAAYLLSTLAVNTLFLDGKPITMLGKDEVQAIASKISGARVGDFACGSGTLLTSAYNALMHLASTLKLRHNININLDDIGKALIEDGVYGIDALRYASQITAINLALLGPRKITRENIFTIYLGILNQPNAPKGPWLGSLELLNNGHVGGILAFIEGGLRGAVERVSVSGVEGAFTIPNEFDLIIMNPPFTRATGRTEAYGERRGLFGFITDEKNRQSLLNNLNKVRDRASEFLYNNAKANKELFPSIIQGIIEGRDGVSAYLNIGPAGEGLLFLYLAHRFIKDGGVVAFVLPRNLLMGVSWFLARVLLATKYHLKYVVVSSDSENGYNFSESTGLSEVLIVARRQDKHSPDEETVFINLLRKPNTALEAIALADEIMGNKHYVTLGGVATARITRVKRSSLLNYILNWNTLANEWLFNYLDSMVRSSMVSIGNITAKTPLTQLNTFIIVNTVNRHNITEAFNLIVHGNRVDCDAYRNKPNAPYVPMICGGGEEATNKMLIQPNAYVPDVNNDTAMRIKSLRSRFFLPYRIIWDTFHTIALRSTEPAISNAYFMVRTNLTEEEEKALTLWLNSFWGILTVFAFMEITVGAFTGLNITQWRLLPVLNVRGLSEGTVKCLANAFDKYVNADFGRFPEQFGRGTRMDMDIDVIKCLSTNPMSGEDVKALRSGLSELYAQFNTILRQISGR